MSSSFSLSQQIHAQSPQAHFGSHLSFASQVLANIEFLPLVLSELNQHGLGQLESLSMLLKRFLARPHTEIFLSFAPNPSEVGREGIELWRFDELDGVKKHVQPVAAELYMELIERPLFLSSLETPGLETIQQFVHLFFPVSCDALISIPLVHKAQQLAGLHLTHTGAEPLAPSDFFLAQILAEVLTPVLAIEQLQRQKKSLSDLVQQQVQQMDIVEQPTDAVAALNARVAQVEQERDALAKQVEALQAAPPAPKVDEQGPRYVASKPPLPKSSKMPPPARPGAAPASKGQGFSLPSIESLRSAFRPDTGPASTPVSPKQNPAGVTAELLLTDVVGEREEAVLAEKARQDQEAAALLADIEIEEEAPLEGPTMLCLSNTSNSSLRSLGRIVQLVGFELKPATTMQHLMEIISVQPPAVIGLSTSQMESGRALEMMGERKLSEMVPMFEAAEDDAQEMRIALHWQGYRSAFLKDTYWLNWLRQTLEAEVESTMLVIGASEPASLQPLGTFLLGAEHRADSYDSPVDGIQILYQRPPRLLVLQLAAESDPWASLLPELSRNARTLEIPIVLFSPGPLSAGFEEALKPFKSLLMTPHKAGGSQ